MIALRILELLVSIEAFLRGGFEPAGPPRPTTNPTANLRRASTAAVLVLLAFSEAVFGATPENGLYWVPGRPAQAYTIEHQGGRVVLVMLSYNESGHAEWFTASGTLQSGMLIGTVGHDYADASYFDAPLLRLTDGPPIGFPGRLPYAIVPYFSSTPIGHVTLEFYGHGGTRIELRLNGQVISDSLERFNFGRGGFGRHEYVRHVACWPNLSGEWVFVDAAIPTRPAWRFKFAAPTIRAWTRELVPTTELLCDLSQQTQELTYEDENSDAKLRCRSTQENSGEVGVPPETYGCNLVDGENILFSFSTDNVQLDRIRAWPGPSNGPAAGNFPIDRNGPPITGFRVR